MKTIDLLSFQKQFLGNLEKSGKSFNTVKNYRTDLNIFNGFLTSKNGDLTVTQITNEQMQEYSRYLESKYNSPNSIRRRVQALRIFFDYLISEDMLDENPVKKILVSPKVVDLPKPCPFHHIRQLNNDIEALFKPKTTHEKLLVLRNKILIHLIYQGILKVSDVERLRTQHITETKGVVRILIAPDKREPYTIPMPKSYTSLHHEYMELLEKQKNANQIDFDNYLFNANPFKILKGGLSARGIEVIFKEFSKQKKIDITAKNLRQAGIFKHLLDGVPHARIKEWMGVQPQYSLKPYIDLLERKPEDYCYQDLM